MRGKPLPADIDVVIDLNATSPAEALLQALRLRLEAARLRTVYNVDIWVHHPSLPCDLVAFFQYLGTKGEAELRLPAKHPKGVLKITL